MIKFKVPSDVIWGCKQLVGDGSDKIKVLNSIRFEVVNESMKVIASNGRILGIFQIHSPLLFSGEWTVPIKLFDDVGLSLWSAEIEITADNKAIVTYNDKSVIGDLLDQKYPNYKKLIPDTVEEKAASYNIKYLNVFKSIAWSCFNVEAFWIYQNGLKAAPVLIPLSNNKGVAPFLGLLMPFSLWPEAQEKFNWQKPDWLTEELPLF